MPITDPRPAPLDTYRLFESTDLDEARSMVARTFCDHRLSQVRSGDRFAARGGGGMAPDADGVAITGQPKANIPARQRQDPPHAPLRQ